MIMKLLRIWLRNKWIQVQVKLLSFKNLNMFHLKITYLKHTYPLALAQKIQ